MNTRNLYVQYNVLFPVVLSYLDLRSRLSTRSVGIVEQNHSCNISGDLSDIIPIFFNISGRMRVELNRRILPTQISVCP